MRVTLVHVQRFEGRTLPSDSATLAPAAMKTIFLIYHVAIEDKVDKEAVTRALPAASAITAAVSNGGPKMPHSQARNR